MLLVPSTRGAVAWTYSDDALKISQDHSLVGLQPPEGEDRGAVMWFKRAKEKGHPLASMHLAERGQSFI